MDQAETPADEGLVRARSARADLLAAGVFIALALAVVYLSWTMPRLENRGIHPLTVPGLVPGLLGLALLVCSLLLAARSLRVKGEGGWSAFGALFSSPEALRVGTVIGLALIYTLGLIGRMPFWAATSLFVFAFIVLFETYFIEGSRNLRSTLLWALGIALATGFAVVLVFERLFLVRLP